VIFLNGFQYEAISGVGYQSILIRIQEELSAYPIPIHFQVSQPSSFRGRISPKRATNTPLARSHHYILIESQRQ